MVDGGDDDDGGGAKSGQQGFLPSFELVVGFGEKWKEGERERRSV